MPLRTMLLSYEVELDVSLPQGEVHDKAQPQITVVDEEKTLDNLNNWFRRRLLHFEGRSDYNE